MGSTHQKGALIDAWRHRAISQEVDHLPVLYDDDGADSPATLATSTWDTPIFVRGYDAFVILMDYTAGVMTGTAVMDAEVSFTNSITDDTVWYTYAELSATYVAGAVTWSISSSTDKRMAFEIPALGYWMRFRCAAQGTNQTGARIKVTAIQDKNSL